MTSLNFLKRFILNEINYFIVRNQYEFCFLGERKWGGRGGWGAEDSRLCDRFGHWSVHCFGKHKYGILHSQDSEF